MILLKRCDNLFRTSLGLIFRELSHRPIISTTITNNVTRRGYVTPRRCITKLRAEYCTVLNRTIGTAAKENYVFNDKTLDNKIIELRNNHNKGRVPYAQLDEVISTFEKTDIQFPYTLSVLLLECCGENLPDVALDLRQKLTDRVWNMIQKNCKLTLDYYNTLLNIYAQNCYSVDPNKFLETMSVAPDKSTYYCLLNALAKAGNREFALDVLSKIKEHQFPMNEGAFNALVYVHAINGDVTKALEVVSSMGRSKISPSSETYAQLACGYAKTGDISNLLSILENTKQSLTNVMKIVKVLSLSGHGERIPDVIKTTGVVLEKDEFTITNVIVQLIHAGKISDAANIICNIPAEDQAAEIKKDLAVYFMKEIVQLKKPVEIVLQFAKKFAEAGYLSDGLADIAEFILSSNNEQLALTMFETMKKKNTVVRPHYYWPLLLGAAKNGGESEIYSVIQHMVSLDVKLDFETLLNFILPYVNVHEPVATLAKLRHNGVPYQYSVAPLIVFLLNNMQLKKSVEVCSVYKSQIDYQHIMQPLIAAYRVKKDMDSCMQLLLTNSNKNHYFIKQFLIDVFKSDNLRTHDFKGIVRFLYVIKENNVKIDQSCLDFVSTKLCSNSYLDEHTEQLILRLLNDLLDRTQTVPKYATQSYVHPSNMNSDQLNCHVEELKSKGMNYRGALRKLFTSYCKENKLDLVENTIKIMNSNDFQWTAGMKVALFDLYVKTGRISQATEILDELQTKFSDFAIDNFKIAKFALLLVENNREDEAFSMIESIKRVNSKPCANDVCTRLLNTIAKNDNGERTEKMLELLISRKYCTVTTALLGPLIKKYLYRNDMKSAIDTFKQIVKLYKETPAKHEIIVELLKQQSSPSFDKNLLDEILNIIQKIHGKQVAITDLIVGLAECGKIADLRKILKAGKVFENRIVSQLKVLSDEAIVTSSLAILEASTNIQNIELNRVCELLLSIYNKLGDCESAVELWRKMETANIVPDRNFRKVFTTLLMSNNYKLPADLINTDSKLASPREEQSKNAI